MPALSSRLSAQRNKILSPPPPRCTPSLRLRAGYITLPETKLRRTPSPRNREDSANPRLKAEAQSCIRTSDVSSSQADLRGQTVFRSPWKPGRRGQHSQPWYFGVLARAKMTTNSITGRSSQAISITHFISRRRRRAHARTQVRRSYSWRPRK